MGSPSRVAAVPALLRRLNVRRVIEALQRHGPCTRAQLTRLTRISPPTMSKLVAILVREGIVERGRKPVPTRGRPGILFHLAKKKAHVVGVVVDIHETTIVAAGLDGQPLSGRQVVVPTPHDVDQLVAAIVPHIRHQRRSARSELRYIGLTVPGLIDRATGRVVFSPNLHFLDGVNLGERLKKELGTPVATFQEEHALCLAAQRFGDAKNLTDFVLLDVSAGFGMGVVSAGRFITGSTGFAGEIGHIRVQLEGRPCGCGNRGCLETVATDYALARAASERAGRPLTIAQVAEEVRQGRLALDGILEDVLEYLALAVSIVVNIFNPQAVLLHGGLFEIEDNIVSRIVERARRMTMRPSLEVCQVLRTSANKPAGAIAGALERVWAELGPVLQ